MGRREEDKASSEKTSRPSMRRNKGNKGNEYIEGNFFLRRSQSHWELVSIVVLKKKKRTRN